MLIALLLGCAQDPVREQAQAWIHDGFTGALESVDRKLLVPELQLAFDLAMLVPARTSGRSIPPALREAAAQRALAAWIAGAPGAGGDEVAARLNGVLGATGAKLLADALRGDTAIPGEDALAAQLKALPLAESAEAMLSVALDREVHPSVRGDLAVHLLLAYGRPTLAALAPVLEPDEDDRFLRLVFTAWRTLAGAEDIERLERIARGSSGSGAQYALQLWARIERDPDRRMEIFDLALAAPGGYASLGLDALAEGGSHFGIAERLRKLLRSGTANQRAIALRALARFDSHEAVLQAYRSLAEPLSVAAAGWWMPVLAQSPLPEAQRAAADWLAAGGIGTGATAQTVTRALADSDAILPLLAALLNAPSVSMREKMPLALTNVQRSADALEFLRDFARNGSGLDQQQAVHALGLSLDPRDLAWLEQAARAEELDVAVRATAFEVLLADVAGTVLMNEWLERPPEAWELREALIRNAIGRGEAHQRDRALALIRISLLAEDPESGAALRSVAWTALADRGDPAAFGRLAEEWAILLERLEPEGRDGAEDWRDLYDRLHAWSELEAVARAARVLVAPISARPASRPLLEWDFFLTSPEVLWAACALWSGVDPEQTGIWLDALDTLPLSEANRIRVRALHAARARQPAAERENLRLLIADPVSLRKHPLYLAQAFAPEGARWTLFHDRLAELELLADARLQPSEQALQRLAGLLEAYVEAELFLRAARFAMDEPTGLPLTRELVARGLALHPLHPDLALMHAELMPSGTADAERRRAWELVMRVAPPGYAQHEVARERLRELAD